MPKIKEVVVGRGGRYVLYRGDCLEVMPNLEAGSVDAVIADPPYGTTACKWDAVIPLGEMWGALGRVSRDTTPCVMCSAQPFTTSLISSNIRNFRYCWVWDKVRGTGFLNSKKQPLRSSEDICIFYRKQSAYSPQMRTGLNPYKTKKGGGGTDNYNKDSVSEIVTESSGERYPLNIIRFERDKGRLHPTQKPVALTEYLIKTYTKEGDTVLDFTFGSCTTGVACMNTNRKFIGIELDEKYFEIGKERIEKAANAERQESLLAKVNNLQNQFLY